MTATMAASYAPQAVTLCRHCGEPVEHEHGIGWVNPALGDEDWSYDVCRVSPTLFREHQPAPAPMCESEAKLGTGTGACDRPIDPRSGVCDRQSNHLTD